MSGCNEGHDFVFLREEKVNEGYDRNPRWAYYDVFHCRRCLDYQRVKTKETVNARDHFGEETVQRFA
jgi:hypothetical protein